MNDNYKDKVFFVYTKKKRLFFSVFNDYKRKAVEFR